MNTLVTGATGGFGSIFAKWLRVNRPGPICLTGKKQLSEEGYCSCDLTDAHSTNELIARLRPGLIFHMAGGFTNKYEFDYPINSLGAKNIIEALLANNIKARVVLIGSAAEYGIVLPHENPIKENQVLRPVSVYGLTKSFQTQIGVCFAHNSSVEVIVARMFNLLAPGLSERLFIGKVEKQIASYLNGETNEILVGNLDAQRDYVSVDQAIAQLNMIAMRGKSGEVYHVASGKPVVMRKLLHDLLANAGISPSVVKENVGAVGRMGYDVPIVFADMTKTNNLWML